MSNLIKNKVKVRQANELIESPYSQEFTAHEIKLFELAVSKFYQEDLELFRKKNNKIFTYSNRQLADLLNTKPNVVSMEIEKIAKRIMKKSIHLRRILEDETVEFKILNIMPLAEYKNGIFNFEINYQIIPYLIDLNKNFTEFQLEHLMSMNSAYAIKLYKLLYQYKNIKNRLFSVEELKEQFGLVEKYALYTNFKNRILEPSVNQINEHTDLNVEYVEVKLGRKVSSIDFSFTLKSKVIKEVITIENTVDSETIIDTVIESKDNELSHIEILLGDKAYLVAEKSKKMLHKLLIEKGEDYIVCSINYAIKNAKTNFEKYLLDTIKNNWAEKEVIQLQFDRIQEEKAKQKLADEKKAKEAELLAKKLEEETQKLNQLQIELAFKQLSNNEADEYMNFTTIIYNKFANKFKDCECSLEQLALSVFAVSTGKSYNSKLEYYAKRGLNVSLNMNESK